MKRNVRIMSVPFVAQLLLALTLLAPSPAHASTPGKASASVADTATRTPRVDGLYHLTITGAHTVQSVDLVVEAGARGYTGVLLEGDHAAALSIVGVDGDTLRATVSTNGGEAQLSLRVTETGISGTLRVSKQSLSISGQRAL